MTWEDDSMAEKNKKAVKAEKETAAKTSKVKA